MIKGFLKVKGSGLPGRQLELPDSLSDAVLLKECEGLRGAVDALRAQLEELGFLCRLVEVLVLGHEDVRPVVDVTPQRLHVALDVAPSLRDVIFPDLRRRGLAVI